MAVDTATHIAAFDTAKPAGSDARTEADDNFRHIKNVLKTDFANIAGAVTASHTELNYVVGVTAAIQTQLDAKGAKAGQTWTGTHDYTGSTLTVPNVTTGDTSTKAANTQFVGAAISAVNAASGNLVRSTNSGASVTVSAGQMVAGTNSGAIAVTFPASPATGTVCGFHPQNGRTDNTIDLGSNSVIGPNGATISGVVTLDQPLPVVLAWYGDYWRGA